MVSVHEEREIKYDADADVAVQPLLELVRDALPATPVSAGEPQTHRLEATYYDTADLVLLRSRMTLRRRKGGSDSGWHLKLPAQDGARSEVRLPLGRAGTVPAPLREMVLARTQGEPLRPVVRLVTVRTVQQLSDASGQALVELADDRVEAYVGLPEQVTDNASDEAQAPPATWREIEVEAVGAGPALMDGIDKALRDGGLVVSQSPSKLARALAGRVPEPEQRPAVGPGSVAAEVLLRYLGDQVETILERDPQVRLDVPDSVHKMRVATRRTRSALQTFRPLVDKETAKRLRAELKWLAGELGRARDAEVLQARLAGALSDEPAGLHPEVVAEAVGTDMEGAYREAHDALLATLSSTRYRTLLADLQAFLADPPLRDGAAGKAGKLLPRYVRRSYRELRDLVDAALDADPPERDHLLHEARKAAKRARYAGEAMTEAFGKPAAQFAAAMESVQEELGEHQDSVVMRDLLHDKAASTTDPRAAFAFGRLHALEQARADRSEARFADVWTAASQKSLRGWLR